MIRLLPPKPVADVQRTKLAALALDAYPEAYVEFKQLGLALLFPVRPRTGAGASQVKTLATPLARNPASSAPRLLAQPLQRSLPTRTRAGRHGSGPRRPVQRGPPRGSRRDCVLFRQGGSGGAAGPAAVAAAPLPALSLQEPPPHEPAAGGAAAGRPLAAAHPPPPRPRRAALRLAALRAAAAHGRARRRRRRHGAINMFQRRRPSSLRARFAPFF